MGLELCGQGLAGDDEADGGHDEGEAMQHRGPGLWVGSNARGPIAGAIAADDTLFTGEVSTPEPLRGPPRPVFAAAAGFAGPLSADAR